MNPACPRTGGGQARSRSVRRQRRAECGLLPHCKDRENGTPRRLLAGKALVAFLAVFSCPAASENFKLSLEQYDFPGFYSESIYLNNGEGVFIRREQPVRANPRLMPRVSWSYIRLSERQLADYVKLIRRLGVASWKRQYPDNYDFENTICDGFSYQLSIRGQAMSVRSDGACDKPKDYDELLRLTKSLFGVGALHNRQ